MSKANKTTMISFSHELLEAIRRVDATGIDSAMTLSDWNAIASFFQGNRSKLSLTSQQQHMSDVLKLAMVNIGDDRHMYHLLAVYFAGKIALANIADHDDVMAPLTKRRRMTADDSDNEDIPLGNDDTDDDE